MTGHAELNPMKKSRIILISFILALLVTAAAASGSLRRLDRWMQDSLFQQEGRPRTDIVIIGIDDTALDLFGPYNTWDRNIMASALEKLAADPDKLPAVTAVDILYAGSSSAAADERLAAAAGALPRTIIASMAEFGTEIQWADGRPVSMDTGAVTGYLEPYGLLKERTEQGHINAMYDTDGVMRHALLYVDTAQAGRVYSLAYQTAAAYSAVKGQTLTPPSVRSSGHFYVPYTAKPGGYSDGVSIAMLIAGRVPADYWAGKIVLIGPYAPSLQDAYFTPIARAEQMYGVEIQANVIQSLLDGRNVREMPDWAQLFILFVLSFAAAAAFLSFGVARGGALFAGLVTLGALLPTLFYEKDIIIHPLWLPFAAAVLYLAGLAFHYFASVREKQALALEKERIGAELALATRIQASALRRDFPAFPDRPEFDLYASMLPAREVGGDLYDFFMPDSDHLALVIGDVSGKGVPAALFMMVAVTLLHHIAMGESSPARALQAVNEEICARNPEQMFVTVWLGILELSTGKMVCANAGHEYPAVRQPDGSFELLRDRHGFVIGGMEGVRYREYEISLRPGASLFVYTDGVTEATDRQNALFGTDRLTNALRAAENGTPEQILSSVSAAVTAFAGGAPQFDDITMLCVRYNGPQDPASFPSSESSASDRQDV